jgi:hypothetical protein
MKARRTGCDRTILAMNDEDRLALIRALESLRWDDHPVAGWATAVLRVIPEAAEQSPKDSEIERVMAAWKRDEAATDERQKPVDVDTFMKDGPLEDLGPDKFKSRVPLPRELKAEAERLLARMESGEPLIGGETPRALALRLAVESRRGMGDASGTVRAAEAFLAFLEGGE